jgi:hypothetical protein
MMPKRFVITARSDARAAGAMERRFLKEVDGWDGSEGRRSWMGGPELRLGKMKDGPVITDNGNFVMDVDFGVIVDPKALAAKISPIPGVVEHGIFDNLDELYLARASRVEIIKDEDDGTFIVRCHKFLSGDSM